jgi:catechol 2,3-dioxygenase-like lactoylglutathione lyase family enzyme
MRIWAILAAAGALGMAIRPLARRRAVTGIVRVARVVRDEARAEAFYRDVLGFRTIRREVVPGDFLAALGAPGASATQVIMRLGAQEIALVEFARVGRAAPAGARSCDLWFQHLAIVVSDMDAAYAHLRAQGGWRAISVEGPVTLPASNGGVRAFKFRDPDDHPVELIWFPPGVGRDVWQAPAMGRVFLGIDHSALSVRSPARSVRFYRGLGMGVASRSYNAGMAQSRLDAVRWARVHVTGLRVGDGMGVELLGYRPPGRALRGVRVEDLVTDWVVFAGVGKGVLRDPDGHLVVFE